MTSFTLGASPHRMTLALSAGTDFVAALTRSDGVDWPAGVGDEVYIMTGVTKWSATFDGPTVSWDIDASQVDALIATSPTKARLFAKIGGVTLAWAAGPVVVS